MNNRHAEKGTKTLLFHRRNVFKTGMGMGVRQVNRLSQPSDQANNPLVECQRDRAPARFIQTARRHQVIAATIVIGQINRTDFGIHRLTGFINQNVK